MKTLLCLVALFSFNSFSQDKDKVSSQKEDIITSQVVRVGECQSNLADTLSQVASILGGSATSLNLETKLAVSFDEVVEVYNIRKTKKDGEKKTEKINIKQVERSGVTRTKRFTKHISTTDLNMNKKPAELVILEATAAAAALDIDCSNTRSNLLDQI